ncbi:MAG: twin-arginine translocation pathway signal [Rhodobacteraceae bacterium]|nr:twin-arginine translocation pathway signal [Paracoccaceae bacterium]
MQNLCVKNIVVSVCLVVGLFISACSPTGIDTTFIKEDAEKIDARVDLSLNQLYSQYPNVEELGKKAAGILVIPLVTEAGFGWGGSFGRGALRVNGVSEDYYSTASAGFGFQIGAQQYGHVLFFMTRKSLDDFKNSQGWAVSGDVEYTLNDRAENVRAETTTAMAPVIAVIFGQEGLKIGISLEGQKYTRIIP